MADPEKALATQLSNIEKRTGKTLAELTDFVKNCGLSKHRETVAFVQSTFELGYGDANTLVLIARKADDNEDQTPEQVLDALYTGKKAELRPIHDRLLAAIREFGEFEEAPKKTYVSYRRKKQFAMIGPATNTRVEVGLNVKDLPASERLEEQRPGQMCQYKVKLTVRVPGSGVISRLWFPS